MNVTKFRELLKENKIPIDRNARTDMQFTKLMISKYIDFNCQFKKGICRQYKQTPNKPNRMCCCQNCLTSVGWLKFIHRCDINKYAKSFSIRTGFWRKDKGCMLPYELRSAVCVFYNCHYEDPIINHGLSYLGYRLKEVEERDARVIRGTYADET